MDQLRNSIQEHCVVRNLNSSSDDIKLDFIDSLLHKCDFIYSLASPTLLDDSHHPESCSSYLIEFINNITSQETVIPCLLLLSLQANIPPESYYHSFENTLRNIMQHALKDQMTFMSLEVSSIVKRLTKAAIKLSKTSQLISTLRWCVELSSTKAECLTPIHAALIQICYESKMFSYASKYLDKSDILEIDPKKHFLTTLDYMKYFYFAGCCYLEMQNYLKALQMFQNVITIPANVLSYVIICAIKKAIITHLLQYGEPFTLPRSASSVVTEFFTKFPSEIRENSERSHLSVYKRISDMVKETKCVELSQYIQSDHEAHQTLMKDCNMEVAGRLVSRSVEFRFKKFSNIYSTMSYEMIRNHLNFQSSQQVEQLVMKMVQSGELDGKIDEVNQWVIMDIHSISSSPNLWDGENKVIGLDHIPLIEGSLDQSTQLMSQLVAVRKELMTSQSYTARMIGMNPALFIDKGGRILDAKNPSVKRRFAASAPGKSKFAMVDQIKVVDYEEI